MLRVPQTPQAEFVVTARTGRARSADGGGVMSGLPGLTGRSGGVRETSRVL